MDMLAQVSAVASFIVPGEKEDPAARMRDGTYSMKWAGTSVTEFREVKIDHVMDASLALPTLYLHFLPQEFRIDKDCGRDSTLDQSLRSGNDMSEVVIKLPAEYLSKDFADRCEELKEHVDEVVRALRSQGEILVCETDVRAGTAQPGTRFFSLKAARAKAPVSLDKKAFGIPLESEQYLFVNNHSSVVYFDDRVKEAFTACIDGLNELAFPAAKKFAVFLKVFYEGGFAYNKKIPMGKGGYLPVNVGTAAMSVVPAFDGQVGIGTGYPYKLPAAFLPFTETVPISINAIREMSVYHGRYGLAFTRIVYVWEGDLWESKRTLDFCSILPHGGFFYIPDSLRGHEAKGGLVYAFGESTGDSAEVELSVGV